MPALDAELGFEGIGTVVETCVDNLDCHIRDYGYGGEGGRRGYFRVPRAGFHSHPTIPLN
jgi:hypothetical protein